MPDPLLARVARSHPEAANALAAIASAVLLVFALLIGRDGHTNAALGLGGAALLPPVLWFVIGLARLRWKGTRHLIDLARQHLGSDPDAGTAIVQRLPTRDRVNLQLAVEDLQKSDPALPPAYGVGWFNTLRDAVVACKAPVPVRWTNLPRGLNAQLPCAENGVFFVRTPKGTPFLLFIAPQRYEVLAAGPQAATEAQAALTERMAARSVYRRQVLSIEPPEPSEETDPDYHIRFHDLPPVPREDIILPEDLLVVVERNVIGLLKHADALRKAGRSTRHGVLFHGPPGVGKTLVTKYLARACPDYTVILLTGRQLGLVRESCRLARLLAPALVVIEDVDLIALDRERSGNTTLLHDLMDEMDGLGPKADVIFLLTTNRAEALEPALAARPGRVDQAVFFPLPDRDCRRRLFAHFSRGLDVAGVNVEPLLDRTDGASPAFLQELFRKAALFAAEREPDADPLRLTTADFDAAIRELVEFGGELTRNLLGFRKKVGF